MYKSPGQLDDFTDDTLSIWNDMIQRQISERSASRFFVADPAQIQGGQPVNAVRWSGAPAEPRFCLNRSWAQKLSDWGVRGRHATQNEYCEYRVVTRVDSSGRVRPKRVDFSSELREYWVVLAMHDPDALKKAANDVLGREPTWRELFDHDDPKSLGPLERRVLFSRMVAGHGYHSGLTSAGVLAQPVGALNRDNVLFMTHPINGLDDLIYIVMFGATPYTVVEDGVERRALLQEIFRAFQVEQLACRNADPNAAAGAFNQVSEGREVAFSEHLGMYLRPLNLAQFEYDGAQIPAEWVRYRRGRDGMYQRLEFGPGDDDAAFLDEISIRQGAAAEPIIGGYQIAELLEVGPIVVVGPPGTVDPQDKRRVAADPSVISCSDAHICRQMHRLRQDYEAEVGPVAHGVRGLSPSTPA